MFNKDIIKICGHNEVETFHENLSEVMDLGNEIACQYEAAKDFERKVNDSPNYAFIKNLNITKPLDKIDSSGTRPLLMNSSFMYSVDH